LSGWQFFFLIAFFFVHISYCVVTRPYVYVCHVLPLILSKLRFIDANHTAAYRIAHLVKDGQKSRDYILHASQHWVLFLPINTRRPPPFLLFNP
jgi:hypothetical protein